MQRRRWLK